MKSIAGLQADHTIEVMVWCAGENNLAIVNLMRGDDYSLQGT
jgi:hypothetical protein